MRRASFDKFSNSKQSTSNNVLFNYASSTKNVEHKRLIFQSNSQSSPSSSSSSNYLQRSFSADNVIVNSRGFKPSDRHDPAKRHFLEHLTSKILHFNMDSGERTTIDLKKLLTPAMDSNELLHSKHKKMYASSCFYAPTHPTVEDQVELARRISYSLSDVKNMKSKGQSMYVNRKKRSVKWIHDGNGDEDEDEPQTPVHKDKVPLKCVMNPNGKVLDMHCIQALGEELNIGTSPQNAEKLFDIVRDLNNQKGRGAEIFAKRRKRSEKWVVDKDQPSTPTTPNYPSKMPSYPGKMDQGSNENSKFSLQPPSPGIPQPENNLKPFYNPFAVDPRDNQNTTGFHDRRQKSCVRKPEPEIKKIYLREVAVGTDPEQPRNGCHYVEKPRRYEVDRYPHPASANRYHKQQGKPVAYPQANGHYQNGKQGRVELEDELDYTPVPVKQLIQEFEKTCRPVLQYKQMSSQKVPVLAHPPLDDISRFFDAPRTPKFDDETRKLVNGRANSVATNCNGGLGNENGYHVNYRPNYHAGNSLDASVRYEYDSTDDEIGDSFGESTSSEGDCDDEYYDGMPTRFVAGPPMNNRVSSASDYDYRRALFDCATDELFEAPPGFRNGECDKFVDTEAEVAAEAKSLVLAGIASQEDILEQIKQLRRTPVLENLVPVPSPESCNKMIESTYSGPKISSFQTLTNYNTAPRGWDQSQSFYRPVTFGKPQEPIAYSDF